MPAMVSSQLFSHTLRGLVVLAVSVTPGVVSSRLFSHALCGLVVLVVYVTPGMVSSWLFSHALHGLVVLAVSVTSGVVSSQLFSHALCGLVVLAVSVTPGVVSSRLFSHALRRLVVLGRDGRSAGYGDRAVGLWREIICNLDQLRSSTTGYLHSPSPYHPHGAPIFPNPPNKRKQQEQKLCKTKACRASKRDKGIPKDSPIVRTRCFIFQGSNAPKSGSEESESVSSASFVGESVCASKRR